MVRAQQASGGAQPGRVRAGAAVGLILLVILGLLGTLLSLILTPPRWIEWIIFADVIVTLLGVTALAFDVLLARIDTRTWLRVASVLVSAAVCAALVKAFFFDHRTAVHFGSYTVAGTCADLTCRLRQHVAPSTESSFAGAKLLRDGTKVRIRCQVVGGPVYLHHGHGASVIWDQLENGRYVSDLFLNTARYGTFDPALQRCSGSAAAIAP